MCDISFGTPLDALDALNVPMYSLTQSTSQGAVHFMLHWFNPAV
jgi:hypothetical protein